MASYKEHISRAKHNEEVVEFLTDPICKSPGWAITITFYAALHYVEAAFTNMPGIHHGDICAGKMKMSAHKFRKQKLEQEISLKAIADDYRELREASEMARYIMGNQNYINKTTATHMFKAVLPQIKNHLIKENLIKSDPGPA